VKFPDVNKPPPGSGVVPCAWCGDAVDIGRAFKQVVCLRRKEATIRAERPTGKWACPDCADKLDAGSNPLAVG